MPRGKRKNQEVQVRGAIIEGRSVILLKTRSRWTLPGGVPYGHNNDGRTFGCEEDKSFLRKIIEQQLPGYEITSVKPYRELDGRDKKIMWLGLKGRCRIYDVRGYRNSDTLGADVTDCFKISHSIRGDVSISFLIKYIIESLRNDGII